MFVGENNIEPLLRAVQRFESFRGHFSTEQEKAGIIQAFEYSFELAWKVMRRILAERGLTVNSPKETFRAAALEGLIDDPEPWFDFLRKRNLTVHTYNESEAENVLSVCSSFSEEIKKFIDSLEIHEG